MTIAGECPRKNGLHINTDSIYIETLQNGKDTINDIGEIVATGLEMETMPLIRYRIKDFGIKSVEPCPCGRNLPLLTKVEGREDDFIFLENGEIIGPRNIVGLMDTAVLFNGLVKNYRIIQKSINKIVVKIVKGKNFNSNTRTIIQQLLSKVFKNKINFELIIVKKIEHGQRGKLRYVISEI